MDTVVVQGGFPITIGLIIAAITTVYQALSTRNADRNRQFQDKAKWIIDNSKCYLDLSRWSKEICSCFEGEGDEVRPKFNKYKENHLLYCISGFYNSYKTFKDKPGFYYFDDVYSEDFLNRIEYDKIITLYKEINNLVRLKQFLESEEKDLECDAKFEYYVGKMKSCLTERAANKPESKAKVLYYSHLVYGSVLDACVNDGAIVTYSSPAKVEKSMRYAVDNRKALLENGIKYLHNDIYKDKVKDHY